MNPSATAPSIWLLLGLSILTAIAASVVGSVLFNIVTMFLWPGDAGVEGWLIGFAIYSFQLFALFGFILGFLALVLMGLPLCRLFHAQIRRYRYLALFTGTIAGALIGALVGLILGFSPIELLVGCILFGASYGLIWIGLVQFALKPGPREHQSQGIPNG